MRPLIGITCCLHQDGSRRHHRVLDRYVEAVVVGAGGIPVLIPAIGAKLDVDGLLGRLDGVLATGSPSNVEPHRYGGPSCDAGLIDPDRDATTLPLLKRAVALGVPLLAICRGMQELNVAFGGTLHTSLHRLPGRLDHRSDKSKPDDERYGPAHRVRIHEGGPLQEILGGVREIWVNSLHRQGIDRLAPGLRVEAVAEDGTVEAVSVEGAENFALGVQWHPEWRVLEDPHSRRLFAAFGEAAQRRARARLAHGDRLERAAV